MRRHIIRWCRNPIIITLVTLLVLVGLGWVAGCDQEDPKTCLETFRDISISILEISAILLLFALIVVFLSWMLRGRQGILIMPFDNATGDPKYDGRAISDSLRAEWSRIYLIHQKTPPKRSQALSKTKRKARTTSYKGAKKKSEPVSALGRPSRDYVLPQPEPTLMVMPSAEGKANEYLADVATVSVKGATVSIGRILITIKQLLIARDPEFLISGSLQKFGTMARLVARRESIKGGTPLFWEVSQVIKSDNGIPNLVNELVFRIFQDTEKNSPAKTWEGLKHLTETLDSYHQYQLTSRTEDLDCALQNCRDAIQAERGFRNLLQVCTNLANAYFDKMNYARAEELFKQAIDLIDPNLERQEQHPLANAWNGYGVSLASEGKMPEAEHAFRQAIRLNRDYLFAYQNLSKVLVQLGHPAEAKNTVRQAAHRDHLKSKLPPSELADWYDRLGLQSEAIENYKHAIESEPDNFHLHYKLGNLYSDSGQFNDAINEFQRAIALHSEDANLHNDLGVVYDNSGRMDDALAEYQRAIELNPEFALPHNNLAAIYANSGRTDDAITEYQQVIDLDPNDADAHNALGNVYDGLGRIDGAIAEYQRAIELDPQNAYAYSGLGYVYFYLGRNDEAIAAYQRAIKLNPNIADFHVGSGDIFRHLGRYDEAITAYQRAIELDPKDPTAHTSLAACYRKLDRKTEYDQQIEIARGLAKEWNAHEYNQACLEAHLGNVDKALELLKTALEKKQLTPDHARRDDDLEFIREDPRFKALVEQSGGAPSNAVPTDPERLLQPEISRATR